MKKRISIFALAFIFLIVGVAGCIGPVTSAVKDSVYAERGGSLVASYTETVNYAYKNQTVYMTDPKLPSYNPDGYTCGIVAASNIIGWYHKQYSGLIPGHVAGGIVPIIGTWYWTPQNAYIYTLASDLSTAMSETVNGVTMSNYLSGFSSYVAGKGRTATVTNLMSGGTLNYSSAKTALEAGKIISIFLNGYSLGGILQGTGVDTLPIEEYAGLHIMAVYGYVEVDYFNAQNVNFRSDKYFLVHTGFGGLHGFLMLNSHTTVDGTYITHIS